MGEGFARHMEWLEKNIGKISKPQRRYKCKNCNNKTTKNQLKKNGGVCFSCKTPIKKE